MQDKHRPCQDGMFSDTTSNRMIPPLAVCRDGWDTKEQACNGTHATTLKAVTTKTKNVWPCHPTWILLSARDLWTFEICAQLSCSTKQSIRVVTSKKKKHSPTFLISEYNWLCFITTEGRGNVHADTAASIYTEKTCLHPTTDSALRPIILMVVSMFHSSKNGSDRCCTNMISGPKTTPIQPRSTWGRATRAAFAAREDTSASKKKAAGRIIEFSNDILKNYTKVKTDVENCRLLQHPLLCKALPNCLHSSRSKWPSQ